MSLFFCGAHDISFFLIEDENIRVISNLKNDLIVFDLYIFNLLLLFNVPIMLFEKSQLHLIGVILLILRIFACDSCMLQVSYRLLKW